uniref:Uncharacterized protein n=1 Tax=Romanomermis culicivorax TaxID=13658 RepID=A0A915KQN3_ROMCU
MDESSYRKITFPHAYFFKLDASSESQFDQNTSPGENCSARMAKEPLNSFTKWRKDEIIDGCNRIRPPRHMMHNCRCRDQGRPMTSTMRRAIGVERGLRTIATFYTDTITNIGKYCIQKLDFFISSDL